MNHDEFLELARKTIGDRQSKYGPPDENLDRIAEIASLILDRCFSAYDISMIHVATKLGRMVQSREYDDNYLDAINYLVFAKGLSKKK